MEIITITFHLDIYGFSVVAVNKDYVGAAFKAMDRMWRIVKPNNLKNGGLNIFVYEPNEEVFAGVELYDIPDPALGLELKSITLAKYAYQKHIGPYHLIRQTGQRMREELRSKGLNSTLPFIEIYGHWINDESKLETELLMSLE